MMILSPDELCGSNFLQPPKQEIDRARRRRGTATSKPKNTPKKKLKLPNLSKLFKNWIRGLYTKASAPFVWLFTIQERKALKEFRETHYPNPYITNVQFDIYDHSCYSTTSG